jgi:hypothetical protein
MADRKVTLSDLVPDRCNFKDKAFEEWVRDFMTRNMPGFPLGLLDNVSADSFTRWEIEPEDRFVVEDLKLVVYVCHDCEEEYPFRADSDSPEELAVCCPLEALGKQGSDREPELFEREERTWLVLRDTEYLGVFLDTAGDQWIDLPGDEQIWGWYERDHEDAVAQARTQNREAAEQNCNGFPWSNGWCYLPDGFITTQELKDAGFTVATYYGGSGDPQASAGYRLCGIDGHGYSLSGAHFAPLAAAVALRCGWSIPTDNGPAEFAEEAE